jgi:hypothetical protein
MKAWLLFVLAACGGGASATQTSSKAPRRSTNATISASTIRDRIKAFCGAKYETGLSGNANADGCDWTEVKGGRGKAYVDAEDNQIVDVAVNIVTKEADAEGMRTAAFGLVRDLFDATGGTTVQGALRRLYQKRDPNPESGGVVGGLRVHASTELDVARPAERWIVLQVTTGAAADESPLGTTVPATEHASPARPVTDNWLADAKAACTELVGMVLKSHKAAMAPAKWEQGELYIDCNSPDENSVARFTVTWAPGTRNVLYAYYLAELPQKKYAAIADRILTPLLTAGQWTVAKTATKKAPLDRKFEAEGLQIGSRHETGGFFGETHEIDISVQVGYKPGA